MSHETANQAPEVAVASEMDRRSFLGSAAATAGFMIMPSSLVLGTQANSAIRVGLLGCGGRGTEDAANMLDTGGARIVALADLFQDQLDAARSHFNQLLQAKDFPILDTAQLFVGPEAYQKIAASKEVDAVIVATPPYFHPRHLEAIVAAGFVLQLDCPDLAMAHHTSFQDLSETEFLKRAAFHVEVLNHSLANVPADRARIHICWGNYEGPHDHDISFAKVAPILVKAKPMALVVEAANPRHANEWTVWQDVKLPDDKILVPGVLDTSTNYVEHPELVAERICRFADIVGRERVIAGSDCGFGTFAGYGKLDPDISFKKLGAMVDGAAIASKRLWS